MKIGRKTLQIAIPQNDAINDTMLNEY
jgi:hypothetical protein